MKKKKTLLLPVLLMALMCLGGYAARAQTLSVYDSTYSSCNNSGRIVVVASGGTAPYTYTLQGYYNPGFVPITQSSPYFTGIPQGEYQIIVSDVNGLNNTAQPAYAYVGATFSAYAQDIPAICPATTGSEYIVAYGSGLYTYAWSTGATTDTITGVPVGSRYQCTVTDVASGCTAMAFDSGGMYQTSSITCPITPVPANCTNGTATAVAGGSLAPYTYLWSTGQTGAAVTGLSAGYYYVTVTDAQGCTGQFYTSITQAITIATQMNATNEHCLANDGTITVSALNGTAPFTYLWSTGQTTEQITGLSAGYFDVTITDHIGCTAAAYGSVQTSTPISLTTSSTLTLCTAPTGTATVVATGGTAPYTYLWSCSPAQATATATALAAGYYTVTAVDAVGCLQVQSATVSLNTTLFVSLYATDPICGVSTGSVSATATGGTGPYSYLWNTGATTTSISGITQSEGFTCRVTDAVGCIMSNYAYTQTIITVHTSVNPTDASCIYTADGSAIMSVSGGTGPYSYHWSNGQTTAAATGFLTGGYYAYATDANGCSSGTPFNIGYASILPCAVTISGTVYDDFNGNCIVDGPDGPLQGVWIACLPGGGYQWTVNGAFDFTLPPGTYSLYQAPPLYHSVICPSSPSNITLTAGQTSPNNNFFNEPDTVRDLAISCIPYTPPVSGFTQHLRIFVRNLGNVAQTPNVVYMSSTDISFLSSSPSPDTYNPGTGELTWNGPMLYSTGTNYIDLYFYVPASLPYGHILNNSDTVYPIVNDTNPLNNYEYVADNVVDSYDPNYIDVLPKGTGAPGYISGIVDTLLRYVVHFQNTGTYPASNVTLKIPIDANLDISTFSFIGASMPVSSISSDMSRLLTINFNNISLPDSSVSRLGSQGFAAFTFRLNRGLTPGTPVTEMSNIYFDYNTPVPTNQALNTINWPAGIQPVAADGEIMLYPNPTMGNATLDLSGISENKVHITIIDAMGRTVTDLHETDLTTNKNVQINTAALAPGVYTVEASGNSRYITKLVKTQ